MQQQKWSDGALVGFDLETTSTDPETARVVTACVVVTDPGGSSAPMTWLVDPGVEIPSEASVVHGITTERARTEGRDAAVAVEEIVEVLSAHAAAGPPLVVMNGRYDLTVLDREARRHGVVPLAERRQARGLCLLDPMVIDRQVDRYRRGRRTLSALCEHYGVPLDGAHSADADAVAAVGVVREIARRWAVVGEASVSVLHDWQVGWARQQADSLAEYFARTPGREHLAASVARDWPMVPAQRSQPDGDTGAAR